LSRDSKQRRATSATRKLSSVLLPGALLLAALTGGQPRSDGANPLLDRRAPEFARRDLSGATVNLASFRGKVVLLNFWATWCAPCQLEMPAFVAWQREYGPRGLQVVGISMDDSAAPVRRTVARLKLDYPVAMGDAKLGNLYGGVLGLPLTFLIDRNGVVRARFQAEVNLKTIEAQMRELLNRQ